MSSEDRYWESENQYIAKDYLDRVQKEIDELGKKVEDEEKKLLAENMQSNLSVRHGVTVNCTVFQYYERGTLQGALEKAVNDLASGAVKATAVDRVYSEYSNHAGWQIFLVASGTGVDK